MTDNEIVDIIEHEKNMDSENIKQILYELGADFCGIASIDRFSEAPKGFNPIDTLPSCKSVIIFGKKFLRSTIECKNTIPYTIARNMTSNVLDIMAVKFCTIMEDKKIIAVPIGAIGPCIHDKNTGRYGGIVSLKHSAVLAGLGYIGRNSLLITPEYGNMVWLDGILADIELEADKIIYGECPENCNLCVEICPVNAIKHDRLEMDQQKCENYAFNGNDFYFTKINCYKCRTICPKCFGNKNKE